MKKRKFAEEGGAVARATMFPNIGDAGRNLTGARARTGRSLKVMGDEYLLGPKLWKRLQVALEARQTPEALMKKARELIIATESTLGEVTGVDQGAFTHALDGGETRPGTHRQVLDGKNKAFDKAFNTEFWGRPMGDRTLKDVNKLLPEDLREPNFGRPTKETSPGVV